MSFITSWARVTKATKPRKLWRATRTARRVDALSRQMGQSVGADLTRGIITFKRRIQPDQVYDAWLRADYSGIIGGLPWENMNEDLDPSFVAVGESMAASFGLAAEALPAPLDTGIRFDTENPALLRHIASRRAENFTNLTEDSAANIREWTTRSFDQALTPRQVAQGIRDSIGLLPAHAVAVERFKMGLTQSGLPQQRADDLASAYANRLLDYRAMNIGRTEVRLATNQGQLSVWRHAADKGMIDRKTAGKTWIVDGNPCPDLCDPMDGITVPLDGFWTLPDGSTCDCPPDGTHPSCMCTFSLEFDGQEADEAA